MSGVAHAFRYLHPSMLDEGAAPKLTLATSTRTSAHPHFFEGRMRCPQLVAQLLTAVHLIVGARFFTPANSVARAVQLADPIVTSGGGLLRFEGFSSCGSTYIRADLLPEAYDGEVVGKGTTNVDFNAPMRAALARVRDDAGLALAVGRDELALRSGHAQVVERKVELPTRWLRALVEVQASQAAMQRRFELSGLEALRLMRTLPKASTARTPLWLAPGAAGLHTTTRPVEAGVRFTDTTRLRVLHGLLANAGSLTIHADGAQQASAWVLDFGSARLTLALSAEVWRGFSGEGQALRALLQAGGEPGGAALAALTAVRAALHWQASLDPTRLAVELGLGVNAVNDALRVLGASGLVGHDVAEGRYFHRELPFDLSMLEDLHPRLADARALLEGGAVTVLVHDPFEASVASGGTSHRVRRADGEWRCTCPWFAKHRGQRGPCKHVLAAEACADGPVLP